MGNAYLTNHIGLLAETSYGTDKFSAGAADEHYLMGKSTIPGGQYPIEDTKFQPLYKNSYNISELLWQSSFVNGRPFTVEAVNGWMSRFMFGSAVNNPAGTFTYTPTVSGQRTSFTVRTDQGNDSENVRDHWVGNMMTQFSQSFNFADKGAALMDTFGYVGLEQQDPGTDVSNPPIFPNSTSNSYRQDSNTILTWDGDDLLPEVVSFNWGATNTHKIHPVDRPVDPNTPDRITTGNQLGEFTLILRKGTVSKQMYTDKKALKETPTDANSKDLVFKIFNTSSLYQQVTLGLTKWNMVPNHVISDIGLEPVWSVTGIPKTIVRVIKDGLAESFHGI